MPEQNEKKETSESESELKSSPSHPNTNQYRDEREERLGLLSEDPKFQ